MASFQAMSGVYMSNASRGIALSDASGLGAFYTIDGGASWSDSNLTAVTANNGFVNATAVMSGANAIIMVPSVGGYYSTNYGVTWTATSGFGSPANIYSLCMNGTHACAEHNLTGVYYSSDSGATWTQSDADATGTYAFAGSSINAAGQAVIGSQGLVSYSTNYGVNWSTSLLNTTPITGGWCLNINAAGKVVLGNEGGIYYSTDGGANYIQSTILTGPAITKVEQGGSFLDYNSDYAIVCSSVGDLYYSSDAGANWTLSSGAPAASVYNALFISGIYAIAGSSIGSPPSLYSTDRGITWNTSTTSITGPPQNVRYLIEQTGVMSSNTNLYYTIDGGNNWLLPTYPAAPPVCFKEDSKILTDKGYKLIQDLRKGDLVKTLKHDFVPINMIGKSEINNPSLKERIKDQLYKCSNEQFPEVFEPLIITGCHSILITNCVTPKQIEQTKEVLGGIYITDDKFRYPACIDERTTVYEVAGKFTIYHIALDHDNYRMNYGIYANGLLVESISQRGLKDLSDMTLIE